MHPSFHTTRWSLVARSGSADASTAQRALGELCEAYWAPLYTFARRSGRGDDDARDLVQGFCARILEHGGLAAASPARGRFRHYLLGAFRHFASNEHRAAHAQKRGGDAPPRDWREAAERHELAASHDDDPERAFERQWAQELLDRALARLRADHATPARRETLRVLEGALLATGDAVRSSEFARQLGCSEGAVRVALHRLRARWRELIREEVAHTVDDPAEIDDELRALQRAVGHEGKPRPLR